METEPFETWEFVGAGRRFGVLCIPVGDDGILCTIKVHDESPPSPPGHDPWQVVAHIQFPQLAQRERTAIESFATAWASPTPL